MWLCRLALFVPMTLLVVSPAFAQADDLERELAAIAQAGPQGAGSPAARIACDAISTRGAEVLPRVLAAMDSANPVAANWLRTAYEAIVAREMARENPRLPLQGLWAFVADPKHSGKARRLALALCDRLEPDYLKRVIPGMITDPEFREDAVEMTLAAGQQALVDGDSETARAEFHKAFEHARDGQQTQRAAGKLAGLGEDVDIAAHLGLVTDWWLVGPFDAPQTSGFAIEFPPERRIDLNAEYVGQDARTITWVRHRAPDPLGLVNLVQALAPAKEAVGYAYAQLDSPSQRTAQLRCGADDNCTVWLNSEKVFGREQWLNGIRFDRFVAPVQLRRGANQLLVKVCQGPPNKDPQVPNNWSLQLRFCDEEGQGLPLRSLLPGLPEAVQ
jgi:hypothetical protein